MSSNPSAAHGFGIGPRFPNQRVSEVPGPGQYDTNYSTLNLNGIAPLTTPSRHKRTRTSSSLAQNPNECSSQDCHLRWQSVNQRNELLDLEVFTLKQQKEHLNREIKELKAKVETLNSANIKSIEQAKLLKEQFQTSQAKLADLNAQLAAVETKLKEAAMKSATEAIEKAAEFASLEARIASTEELRDRASRDREMIERTLRELSEAKIAAENEFQARIEAIKFDHQREKSELSGQIAALETAKLSEIEVRESLKVKFDEIEAKAEKLKKNLIEAENRTEKNQENLLIAQNNLEAAKKVKEIDEEKIASLVAEVSEKSRTLVESSRELAAAREEIVKVRNNFEEEMNQAISEIHQLETLNEQIRSIAAERESELSTEISTLKTQFEQEKGKFQSKLAEIQSKLESNINEKTALQSELELKNSELVRSIEFETSKFSAERVSLTREISDLQKNFSQKISALEAEKLESEKKAQVKLGAAELAWKILKKK